jgi:hypothetical protein
MMRRSLLAALIATMLLAWPARAQIPTERVLVDSTLWINPPSGASMCMLLEAGQLSVATRLVKPAIEGRPITLSVNGLMEDLDTQISAGVVESETITTQLITGGRYCWTVDVDAPETEGMANAQRGAFTVNVALKITLTPE